MGTNPWSVKGHKARFALSVTPEKTGPSQLAGGTVIKRE